MISAALKLHNKIAPDGKVGEKKVETALMESSSYDRSDKRESVRIGENVEEAGGEKNDLKQVQSSRYQPGRFDVWAMVITTVIGGLMYGWNAALEIGFGGFIIAQVLVSMAFIVLAYGLAEIVSTSSFSGGSYGMARVILGFYPGFLVACFELIEYLSYSAASTEFVTKFIVKHLGWDDQFQPIVAFFFYLSCLTLLLERNHFYWRTIYVIALFSLVVLLTYCFGSLPFTNFAENASMHVDSVVGVDGAAVESNDDSLTPMTRNWFRGGVFMFFKILPYTTWGFAGIESGALVTDLIEYPRKNLPEGLIAGVWSLFGLLMFTIFVCVSLPPGMSSVFAEDDEASATRELFMDIGYGKLGVSADVSEWLLLPAQVGMAFGFMLPAAKLYHAMAESKLVPFFTCRRNTVSPLSTESTDLVPQNDEPEDTSNDVVYAFAFTLPASYAIYLLATYYEDFDLTNTPIILAVIVYISDLYAYYQLLTKYDNLEREFRSPFGKKCVYFATAIFLSCLIGMIGFMEDYQLAIMLVSVTTLLSVYYFFAANTVQILSPTEQRSVFVLHVINFNRAKRRKITKKKSFSEGGLKGIFAQFPEMA